jgi:predicted DNA-binding protein with PD1-like motif
MKSQRIDGNEPADIHIVVLDNSEDAFSALQNFARETKITAASLTAIGD